MNTFTCIDDYEKFALKVLTPSVRDYYKSGAGDEITLNWNKKIFKKYIILISINYLHLFILFFSN